MSECVCGFNPPGDPNPDCERCGLIAERDRLRADLADRDTRIDRVSVALMLACEEIARGPSAPDRAVRELADKFLAASGLAPPEKGGGE